MRPAHADEVLKIYQLGIDEGNATFETTAPTWEHFNATKLPDHRHVVLDDSGTVLGWVAPVPVSDRCVYAGVVEHSVYVHPDARGRGSVSLRVMDVVQVVRRLKGLSLWHSKVLVTQVPAVILVGVPEEDAAAAVSTLRDAGGQAESREQPEPDFLKR
ncbi:ribosomal protein L7/L12 [Streptomyces sp. NPDC005529]|uniref:ribosomal protein L7/L12 n=1 Tax=unclassified Streptomyces TaxID=2593676 RepID=UPI0033B50EFE